MSVLETLWLASLERERVSNEFAPDADVEVILSKLINQRNGMHKTFGQWMQFFLEDGIAYFALHVAIRTGDFELREAAIRDFTPNFMGYAKNKYNQLCMIHLNDIVNLSSSERGFIACVFSLSISGIEGKNVVRINRVLKDTVPCTEASFIREETVVIQARTRFVDAFKAHYAPDPILKRKVITNRTRLNAIRKMKEYLQGEHCPFHPSNEIRGKQIVALDARVATSNNVRNVACGGDKRIFWNSRGRRQMRRATQTTPAGYLLNEHVYERDEV